MLCAILFSSAVAENNSSVITIDEEITRLDVTTQTTRVYAGDNLNLSSVREHIDNWLAADPLAPIPQDTKVWAKTRILNDGLSPASLTLVAGNKYAKQVQGYVVDPQRSILNAYTSSNPNILGHNIGFNLAPGDQVDVYIAVDDIGPTYLPLMLWETSAYNQAADYSKLIHHIFIGCLVGLMLYFFFSYFVQRNVCRFWFSGSLLFFTLFSLDYQGFEFPRLLGLLSQTDTQSLLIGVAFLTATKVTHYLIFRVPRIVSIANYLIALSICITPLLTDTYFGLVFCTFMGVIWMLLQIALSLFYPDRRHTLPAFLYAIAWAIATITTMVNLLFFSSEVPLEPWNITYTIAANLCAIIVTGIAIETSERDIRVKEFSYQEKRIANLRHFYDLFNNSAEGLYTSTLDGRLLSANLALCHLFGYEDEENLLHRVQNTASFYAQAEDRKKLIEELQEKGSILGREIRGKRRDGSEFWFSISCQIQREANSEYLYGSVFDITERKQTSLSLEHMATHDSLTGVLNRREFDRTLDALLHKSDSATNISLLYIDLDRFKQVNDSCGHKAGDELIKNVAHLIHQTVAGKGDVARLGGDEFAVLCQKIDHDQAYILANKVLHAIQDYRFFYDNRMFTIGASIGFLEVTDKHVSSEQLVTMADAACYSAKELGRNRIHRHSSEDTNLKRQENELIWLNKINEGLKNNKFTLYFQSYQSMSQNDGMLNIEVLLRLNDDENGMVLPEEFLATADRFNISHDIDTWVVENTFAWFADNPDVLTNIRQCNINLSGLTLTTSDQKLVFIRAFEKYAIPYEKICFEVKEATAVVRQEETIDFITTFKNLGCQFALDDFGNGVSSYGYLQKLPVDYVKIDGKLVKGMLNNPLDKALLNAINEIAHALNIKTMAEFVEDDLTLTEVGKVGVDYAQGYMLSEPKPLVDLATTE